MLVGAYSDTPLAIIQSYTDKGSYLLNSAIHGKRQSLQRLVQVAGVVQTPIYRGTRTPMPHHSLCLGVEEMSC